MWIKNQSKMSIINFKLDIVIITLGALVLGQARVSDPLPTLPDDGKTTDFCNATVGKRSPDAFRIGEEVRLSCTCPGGCSRSQLVFQHAINVIADSNALHPVNSSTKELRLLITSVNQSGLYRCCRHSCEETDDGPIENLSVRVGDEPSGPLSDARCVSHGHRFLECSWRHDETGNFPVRYSAYFGKTTGGNVSRWLNVTNDDVPNEREWDDSHFRMEITKNVNLFYSVKLCARNLLGCQCGAKSLGLLLDIMKPKAVKDPEVTWSNSSSAVVRWRTPDDLYRDVDPVKYRVNYTWPDADKPAVTRKRSNVTEPNKTKMVIQDLHPYTKYNVTIEARPVAKKQLKGEWGVPAHFTFSTAKAVPQAAPEVEPGMFCKDACPSAPSHTCLFLFWKPIPRWAYGDSAVRYLVTMHDGGDTQEAETQQLIQHFQLSGALEGSTRFTLRAANGVGVSEQSSELAVYYPTPPKPKEVKQESLREHEMNITWDGPPNLNYTVFWCVKGSGSTCAPSEKGALHSKMVGPGVRKMKIDLVESAAYSYAVASLYYDVKERTLRSSEMSWGEDTRIVLVSTTIASSSSVKSQTTWIIGTAAVVGVIALVAVILFSYRKYRRHKQEDVEETARPIPPDPPSRNRRAPQDGHGLDELQLLNTRDCSSPENYAHGLEFDPLPVSSTEQDVVIHVPPQSRKPSTDVPVQMLKHDRDGNEMKRYGDQMKNSDVVPASLLTGIGRRSPTLEMKSEIRGSNPELQLECEDEKATALNNDKKTDMPASNTSINESLPKSDGACSTDALPTEAPADGALPTSFETYDDDYHDNLLMTKNSDSA